MVMLDADAGYYGWMVGVRRGYMVGPPSWDGGGG
jgi:hypothetical protein